MGCACTVKGGTFKITNWGHPQYIDEVNGIEPVRFCHWAAPEWGVVGQTAESSWYKAAMIAVATLNTATQVAISLKQYNLAKDYANLATEKWERFRDAYMPCEEAALAEVCNTPEYTVQYGRAFADYSSFASTAYSEADNRLGALARRYSLCMDPSLVDDILIAAGVSTSDGINMGYRYEENRKDVQDDLRWNRRSSHLNLGRDNHAQSASYAQAANGLLGQLGQMAGQGAAGAMGLLGYLSERRDTQYPSMFQMPSLPTNNVFNFGMNDSLYEPADPGFDDMAMDPF